MNIEQTPAFCKPANANIKQTLTNSNFTPHVWYHKVVRGGNKSDNIGIIILSELLQLHLSSETSEREFQLSYSYLQNKFNHTYDQVYEACLRLEKQGLISRKGKTIVFNVENVLALSDSHNNENNDSSPEYYTDTKKDSNDDKNTTKEISLNSYLYIDILESNIKDKKEEYISGSSFNENATAEDSNSGNNPECTTTPLTEQPAGIIKTAKKWVRNLTRQPIAKFHPLTEEDAEALRLSSNREFNLHFINQLVLRLGDKYPNHSFYSKKLFLKYMTSVLANEMRQTVKVNNEGFRFKRTDDEGVAEEYLAKVEDGYGNKASDQIRRKVAATFEPAVAYKILTSCYFPDKAYEGKYEIKQRVPLELSNRQYEQLHSQISAVFGDSVRSIEIKNSHSVTKKAQSSVSKELQVAAVDTTTLWGRVRNGLIATYGEAIDKSWFSRLEDKEDAGSRKLILTGTSFLTDYIRTHYSHVIERLCAQENYTFKFC